MTTTDASPFKKLQYVPKPASSVCVVVFCAPRKHTHTFNSHFTGSTQVSRYQKGKTNLDFTEAREWQWHQLGQTDNHVCTVPLSFFTGRMLFLPPKQQCRQRHGNVVDNTVECWGELQRLLANLNALVAASKGMRAVKLCIYTVSQKTRHLTLVQNFTKYWPIFKILSLLDSVGNL